MVKQCASAFIAGAIFGFGLCLSAMVNPAVVVGFADVTGRWDPRLLLVMGGALAVTMVSFPLILKKMSHPVCGSSFQVPANRMIDRKLVLGAVLFGIGWGFGGVCPGPAVTGLAFLMKESAVFLAAMLAGMWAFESVKNRWFSNS